VVRDGNDNDRNFIMATAMRSICHSDPRFKDVPHKVFMDHYHPVLESRVDGPFTIVKVACLTDDPDTVLGYALYRQVGSQTILDYVYVKAAWRRIGVAKSVMPPNVDAVTHLTAVGKKLMPKGAIFNPFI